MRSFDGYDAGNALQHGYVNVCYQYLEFHDENANIVKRHAVLINQEGILTSTEVSGQRPEYYSF
jgi:hypothetical protein